MIDHDGVYIVFEGADFVGKTTVASLVEKKLKESDKRTTLTKHPGATPLGQHLRKLVKTPDVFNDNIEIDPMSAQILMMVDQICFINTVLTPKLDNKQIVLADRSNFISGIVYGLAEGLQTTTLNKLFQLADSPTPDRVFILRVSDEIRMERAGARRKVKDRFEDQGNDFISKVANIYDNLLVLNPEILVLLTRFVPVENIIYKDSTKPIEELAEELTQEILHIAKQKCENPLL